MGADPINHLGDYAFLSDCRTAALVSSGGSIDWYCPGRFDAPSLFGRLLDPDAGHWSIAPAGSGAVSRAYEGRGLVLRTEHSSAEGGVSVTDALVQAPGTGGHELGINAPGLIVRSVEGLSGRVTLDFDLCPRAEYGLTVPQIVPEGNGAADTQILAGPLDLALRSPVPLRADGGRLTGRFEVGAGDRVTFSLSARGAYSGSRPEPPGAEAALTATSDAWSAWSDAHGNYQGLAKEQVERSAAVLQGLTYGPSGALLAAATTSLPERLGEPWNWDYRFAWLRDSALFMRALWVAACPDEVTRLFEWLARSIGPGRDSPVQIVFGVEGERRLAETELPWLRGFDGNGPVRVGNDAWKQRQHDVMGEVLDIALLLRDQLGEFGQITTDLLVSLADEAAGRWREPDSGMWEARDRERRYLTSAVMCWVALDRALELGIGSERERARWKREREAVHRAVLEEGWDEPVGAFTGAFGSHELDASVLIMPLVGFCAMDDERMRRTVEVIDRELTTDGLVRRWGDDPNGFLICSFWLVECLALDGQVDRARKVFQRVAALANDVGVLAEMADIESGEPLGNLPQAFSHAGLINAAWRLTQVTNGDGEGPEAGQAETPG